MVCHISISEPGNPKVKWISRRATDYSELYSVMNPFIEASLSGKGIRKAVLDGEMVAWDPRERKLVPFGQNRTIAAEMQSLRREEWQRHLFFIPFDLLLLERAGSSQVLLSEPLGERRRLLSESITPVPHFVEICRSVSVGGEVSRDERRRAILDYFDTVVNSGEGLFLSFFLFSFFSILFLFLSFHRGTCHQRSDFPLRVWRERERYQALGQNEAGVRRFHANPRCSRPSSLLRRGNEEKRGDLPLSRWCQG